MLKQAEKCKLPGPSAGSSQQNAPLMIDLLSLPVLEVVHGSDRPQGILSLGHHGLGHKRKEEMSVHPAVLGAALHLRNL